VNKPIVNVDEIELQPRPAALRATGPAAERYEARMAPVSQRLGAQKLGYNVTALPPGKRAFPAHSHRVNEEMFFILGGVGEVRIGKAVYSVRQGDFIACPPGGKETAHQIVNTGSTELKYLAVSTKVSPDVVDYPDSGKFGVLGELPGPEGKSEMFRFIGRENQKVDYWEGE
jgi:uncharacterized cupin superfamily protein